MGREAWLLCSDRAGSVLLAQTGAAVQRRTYCPYGYGTFEGGPSVGYNGEWLDCVVQGYLLGNGYRLYSPRIKRFLSPDGISPFGQGGLNAYAYCAGDPGNRVDPSGHKWSFSGFLKAVGLMSRTGERGSSQAMNTENSKLKQENIKLQQENIKLRRENITLERRIEVEQIRTEFLRQLYHVKDGQVSAVVHELSGNRIQQDAMLGRDRVRAFADAVAQFPSTG